MATLRIYLFGGLRVYHGEDPLPPFPTQKTRSLFAYLATFRDRPHPRDALASTFWSDMPSAQARRNLNTTIWRLRRTVPAGYLQVQGDSLAFAPEGDYWLDVAAFENTLQQAGLPPPQRQAPLGLPKAAAGFLHQAVELYRGDLLAGFYEDWCLVEAERLRSLYLQALHGLLSHYRAGGEHEQALEYARRLLDADPLREDIHQQAMEMYEMLGRHDEAMAQFDICRRLLQDELGVAPLPETVALYERIRAAGQLGPPLPAPPLPTRPAGHPLPRTPFDDLGRVPLAGREGERESLTRRLDEAGRGHGGMILLEGEAGVGKTRLLQEVTHYAERQGWLILRGSCSELHEPPPYQAWVEALRPDRPQMARQCYTVIPRPWLAELALLLPELGRFFPDLPPPAPLPPPQRSEQLQQALLQCLKGLAQIRPCLIVLEDLQWADAATVESLLAIVPCLQDVPVLVAGAARAEEIPARLREVLHTLESAAALHRAVLPRLSRDETGQLAGDVLGWTYPAPLFVERLYRETEGNPFFVIEALKGLFEEGRLARDHAGQWSLVLVRSLDEGEWPFPGSVRQAIQRRLERLGGNSRQMLELAAVVGSEVDAELLWRISGWNEETFLEATDDLLRRQLLIEAEEQLRLANEKIRQVIYRGISATRRRQLHRAVGQILEKSAPQRVEELANHFFLSRQPQRALPYCLQAGERALSIYAASAALTYYGWAITAAARVGRAAGRAALLQAHERRGQVYDHLGDSESALAEYEEMLAVAREAGDPAAVARAIRLRGWIQGCRQNHWDVGLREAQRAYEVATAAGASSEAALALRDSGACHCMRGEYQASLEALRAALAFFRESGDTAEEAVGLQYLAVTYLFLSQNDQALQAYEQALAIREQLGDRRIVAKILTNLGLLQINRGALAEAGQFFRRAETESQAIGALPGLPIIWVGLATVYRLRGDCAESLQILGQALEVGDSLGEDIYTRALALFHRGWAQWDMGRLGPGLADLRESLALGRQSGIPTLLVGNLDAVGEALRLLGAADQAQDYHQEAVSTARHAAFAGGEVEALTSLGLAHIALGHIEQGRELLVQGVRQARSLGRHVQTLALVVLAEACLAEWRLRPAQALARRVVHVAEQMGSRPLLVRGLSLQGQALAGLGQFQEAARALRQALDEADPPGYPLLRWRILLALANVQLEQGQPGEAEQLRAQARAIIGEISASLEDIALRQAFTSQPAVRALLGGAEEWAPTAGLVRLPMARLGAPTGRPLHDEEQVTVLWTMDAGPEDAALQRRAAKSALRRQRILRLVAAAHAQGAVPTETDLAQALGVSTRTIRSDIAALRRAGRRVHTRGTRPPA